MSYKHYLLEGTNFIQNVVTFHLLQDEKNYSANPLLRIKNLYTQIFLKVNLIFFFRFILYSVYLDAHIIRYLKKILARYFSLFLHVSATMLFTKMPQVFC